MVVLYGPCGVEVEMERTRPVMHRRLNYSNVSGRLLANGNLLVYWVAMRLNRASLVAREINDLEEKLTLMRLGFRRSQIS